jgi:hypothetical protein
MCLQPVQPPQYGIKNRTVVHEDRVRLHPNGRKAPGEFGAMHPVRRRPPPVEVTDRRVSGSGHEYQLGNQC